MFCQCYGETERATRDTDRTNNDKSVVTSVRNFLFRLFLWKQRSTHYSRAKIVLGFTRFWCVTISASQLRPPKWVNSKPQQRQKRWVYASTYSKSVIRCNFSFYIYTLVLHKSSILGWMSEMDASKMCKRMNWTHWAGVGKKRQNFVCTKSKRNSVSVYVLKTFHFIHTKCRFMGVVTE
jgi:hypothetical protein